MVGGWVGVEVNANSASNWVGVRAGAEFGKIGRDIYKIRKTCNKLNYQKWRILKTRFFICILQSHQKRFLCQSIDQVFM